MRPGFMSRPSSASADDYQVVGTAHFDAGQSTTVLEIDPTDDSTPEWTETVVVRLQQGPGYRIFGTTPAKAEIVDNDLSLQMPSGVLEANYDDDNADGVLDYQEGNIAGDDLYEVDLNIPQEMKPGATVRLTGPTNRLNVWSTQAKQTKLLGDGLGDTHQWIVGTETVPTIVWLEVVHGSAVEGDLSLTLSA